MRQEMDVASTGPRAVEFIRYTCLYPSSVPVDLTARWVLLSPPQSLRLDHLRVYDNDCRQAERLTKRLSSYTVEQLEELGTLILIL